jgi:hypothetical protein
MFNLSIFLFCFLVLLQACSIVAQYPISSASTGLWATTGKGPVDHALSKASGKDCELVRFIGDDSVCLSKKPLPPVEERSIQVAKP